MDSTKNAQIDTKKQNLTTSNVNEKTLTTNTNTNHQINSKKTNMTQKELVKKAKKETKKKLDFLSKIANFFKDGYNYVAKKLKQGEKVVNNLGKQFSKRLDKTMRESHGAGNMIFMKSKNLNGKACQKYLSSIINFRDYQNFSIVGS